MGKVSLRCGSCQYRFSRSVVPTLCPFCGKGAVEADTHKSAADILTDVEDMERSMAGRR